MRVPTDADWGDYQVDSDQESAYKMFGGHSNQEMIAHFNRNVIERTDELRWMPAIPFQYYMIGFRDFVLAGEVAETWTPDAANCFLNLILEKLEKQPEYIVPIMSQLLSAVRQVAANQASFGASQPSTETSCKNRSASRNC
jgi:hypothetical protein